ncbi:MAG: phytanoyl-CoA dioxygenase [Pirellula sp.]|nr:phytanoyl-CoA dioxygenase [Pirellula sp.]
MSRETFATEGFAIVPGVIAAGECEAIAALAAPGADSVGSRCLLPHAWCARLAKRVQSSPLLSELVPADYAAVQCTYFEKSAERNWLVPVHQDLSIPVAQRVEHPALGGWSEKEGSLFVQPPVETLEQLIAVRLHLDVCSAEDGPLRVVPGSHRLGRMAPEAAVAARQRSEVSCLAERGAVLAMRPLLLHASSKSQGSSRRRVLHFVYGPRLLNYGLRWRHAV